MERRKLLTGAAAMAAYAGLARGQVSAPPGPALPLARTQGGLGVIGSQLPNWRKAMEGVCTGSANATVLVTGDSTTFGMNAAYVFTPKNVTYHLAQKLQASNPLLLANQSSVCGDSGVPGDARLGVDPRFSSTGTVTLSTGSLGGGMFSMASGATITFTPGTAFNGATVTAFNGSISVVVTGGSAGTVTAPFGFAQATATTATASASNTVTITATSAVYVAGIQTYNSTSPGINIINAGNYGAQASAICGPPGGGTYTQIACLQTIAPVLTILNVGINDWNAGTTVATFMSYVQPFVAAALALGDVILAVGVPSTLNGTNNTLIPAYQAALAAYAQSVNIPFVDFVARWQSYTSANSYGMMSDALHPSAGYGMPDIAQAYAEVLLAA